MLGLSFLRRQSLENNIDLTLLHSLAIHVNIIIDGLIFKLISKKSAVKHKFSDKITNSNFSTII